MAPDPWDALSLRAAAAEAPAALALVDELRPYTFAELAAALPEAPTAPVHAEGSVQTLLSLYAAWEARQPFAPTHPRWPQAQRRAWAEAYVQAPVAPGTALVVPTSGSSGPPRGVCLSPRALVANAAASEANLGWRPDDRWALAMPLAHVGGLSVVSRSLIARRPVVLSARFEAPAFAARLIQDRVTLCSLVPTMLEALLADPSWRPPPSLRAVLLGGAAASEALLDAARARGVPALTTWGMTETCGQVTTAPLGAPPSAAQGAGRPLPGQSVWADDAQRLWVDGDTLAHAWHPPAPWPGRPWRTGDLGHLDAEGRLHLLGRADEVIVTGGEKVHPAQVEAAATRHPGVEAALAFASPDPRWGAVVALALVGSPAPGLLAALEAALPTYARPRLGVCVEALPQTLTGKPSRRLAQRELGPTLAPAREVFPA